MMQPFCGGEREYCAGGRAGGHCRTGRWMAAGSRPRSGSGRRRCRAGTAGRRDGGASGARGWGPRRLGVLACWGRAVGGPGARARGAGGRLAGAVPPSARAGEGGRRLALGGRRIWVPSGRLGGSAPPRPRVVTCWGPRRLGVLPGELGSPGRAVGGPGARARVPVAAWPVLCRRAPEPGTGRVAAAASPCPWPWGHRIWVVGTEWAPGLGGSAPPRPRVVRERRLGWGHWGWGVSPVGVRA